MTQVESKKQEFAVIPINLLNAITGILLELPAKQVYGVLKRIEAEVRADQTSEGTSTQENTKEDSIEN